MPARGCALLSRPGRTAYARVLLLLALTATAACSDDPAPARPRALSSALTAPVPGVSLPPDALLPLVPSPAEVPRGMVPLLSGSGPRGQAAIAAYSADATTATRALADHGFERAYVAQYAEQGGSRVLSVVVVRFRDAAGATADLTGDLAASAGDEVDLPVVGDQSQARRQPFPGTGGGQLVTVRFRKGTTTWLLAYGDRPKADPAVAADLARLLVARA